MLAFEDRDRRFRFEQALIEDKVLLVPVDHPLTASKRATLEQIAEYPLMLLEVYAHLKAQISEVLAARGLTLGPDMSAGNLSTLLGFLDAKMGIAQLAHSMAITSQRAGHVVVEIDRISLIRTYGILSLRASSLGATALHFKQYVMQAMKVSASG